ncbi:ABC transporter type 1, transmembrane domain-containing protein [Linnemannia elongata]|nr:ABC transporter type 1, transmembrane domain-containing protein [Linnemannia elongata]
MSSGYCRDLGGWGPTSPNRIDLAPCFEYTILSTLPALLAIVGFSVRTWSLYKDGTPHELGRTNWIFWPGQGAMLLTVAVLLVRAGVIGSEDQYSPASLLSSVSMAVAWIFAMSLNVFEHRYEIRSSTAISCYYLLSLISGSITTRTLSKVSSGSTTTTLYYIYLGLVIVGFAIEAWPRGKTQVQQKSTASSYEKANIFSRFLFHYLQHLITDGYKRPLQATDVQGMMPPHVKTQFSYTHLSQKWDRHVAKRVAKGKKPFLFGLILKSFGFQQWTYVVFLRILASGLAFVAPQLMSTLLDFVSSYDTETPQPVALGIILAFGMFFSTIGSSIIDGQFNQRVVVMGIEARTALVSMIYRKALKLSPVAKQTETPGEINNHMSVDCERWNHAFPELPFWFSIPLEICIATWLLYRQLGWSGFGGVGAVVLVMPMQMWIAKHLSRARDEKLTAMDNRIRLVNEVLSGVKIVKLYGWESSFRDKIAVFRQLELAILHRIGVIFSYMNILFSSMTLLMALVSFSLYATVGGPGFTPGEINSQTIFVSITLFGLVNRPIGMISYIMGDTIGLLVSSRRIQDYLLAEELLEDQIDRSGELPQDHSVAPIEIEDATFGWDKEHRQQEQQVVTTDDTAKGSGTTSADATLRNITLSVGRGNLTAIVGRVGQGKTSLFGAMIGDMYKWKGTIRMSGRIAYVPQQAWIVNATLQDNVTFGAPFDKNKYERIIYGSGLKPDIEMLPAGDQTEIGERGINLSGGQKQRVSLARAAYQDADIYLLDDPLSAVDAHVDQHLWQNLIGPNGLLKDKTRLLVTHGIHHLSEVDQIVVIKDGEISETGRYQELLDARNAFYQLIQDYSVARKEKDEADCEAETIHEVEMSVSSITHQAKAEKLDEKVDNNADLTEEEAMEIGSIQWPIYKIFAKAAGYGNMLQAVALFAVIQACQIGTNIWLQNWIKVAATSTHGIGYYMGIYTVLVVIFMGLIFCASYKIIVMACVQAADRLHSKLLTSILRMPMNFFDTTPIGRILNRFSSDIFSIDEMICWTFFDMFLFGASVIGSLVVIATTTPVFLAIVPPVFATYVLVMSYYIAASRAFKRIESVARSPMYQHFSETLYGVSTIRVVGCSQRFIDENASRSDDSSNAHFVWAMGNRWLNVRLECLGSVIVLGASVFAVLARNTLSPSMVGMSLSYALTFTQDISWLVRGMCESQFHLVAVERIDEYAKKNQEAPNLTDVALPENWPAQGRLSFKSYSTRYRQGMDLVLKKVSFEVLPGEKVGIVGRTGAGKSSLTLALFRIIEAANSHWAKASHNGADMDDDVAKKAQLAELEKVEVEEDGGSIWIDGIDISTVGLETLRQHLAIIPQDPTLFVGTVRENLDPFDQTPDSELWEALERAHLKEYISSMPGGLSYEVTQNGDNFSVGQRSLICLARALLRKTKILVLDEATAAVDVETDELIQRTIREEFKDRTILTIAHRIKTVMDSDKILVREGAR